MTLEEELQQLRAMEAAGGAPQESAPFVPYEIPGSEEDVDPSALSSSIGRAVEGYKGSVGGTLEALGQMTELEPLEQYGQEMRTQAQQDASQYGEAPVPDVQSAWQAALDGDLAETGAWVQETFSGALPSVGAQVATGWAAAKAAPLGMKPAAFLGGAFSAGLLENSGNIQNLQRELNPDQEPNLLATFGGGATVAALDAAGLGVMAKPLIRTIGMDAAERFFVTQGVKPSLAKEVLKGAALGSTSEAVLGATQAAVTDVAAMTGAEVDLDVERIVHDAVNGAAGGVITGAPFGAGARGVAAVKAADVAPSATPARPTFEDEGTTEVNSLGRRLWNEMTQGSLEPLTPWARTSSEMKKIIREFRPDESGREATGPTIFEDQMLMAGKYNTKLDELIQEAGGEEAFSLVLDDVAQGNYSNPLAKKYKDEFSDSIWQLGETKGGLEMGYIQNHMPFTIDQSVFDGGDRETQFISDITPFYSSPAEAQVAVDNYKSMLASGDLRAVPEVNRLVAIDPFGNLQIDPRVRLDKTDPASMRFKFAEGTRPPKYGHFEKARAFNAVPQNILNKYVTEQTPRQRIDALRDYVEGGTHRIAFSSRFGPDGDLLNGRIAKAVRQAQAAGRKITHSEVSRMYDVADAYNGLHGAIKDPSLKTANSVLGTAATFKVGALFALSSLAEISAPAIRGDVSSALRAIGPVIGEGVKAAMRSIKASTPRTEWGKMAAEANLTLSASTGIAAQKLGQSFLGSKAQKWTTGFFKLNGLSYITHATTVYAAKTGDTLLMQGLKELAAGVPMNSPRGRYVVNQLNSMGVRVKDQAHAKALFSPVTQSQRTIQRETRKAAMARFARQAVLEPNVANTPLWQNNASLSLVAMLKRYPTAFTNTLLPALLRKADPQWAGSYNAAVIGGLNALMIGGFMLTAGYMSDELRMWMKGVEEDERTDEQRFADVVTSTVAPVYVSYVSDMLFSQRFGSSPAETILGPGAGILIEGGEVAGKFAGQAIGQMEEEPTQGEIWKFLFRQTPLQFNRPLRESAGELEL